VLAVLTGKDQLDDGIKPIPHNPFAFHPAELPLSNKDGSEVFVAPQYALAYDKARFVGEGIAIVIAETVAAAKDAAEQVEVDYEVLTPITGTREAAEPDAPRVWDEHNNVCIDAEVGDREATDAAFKKAAHVVRFDTWVQRVTGVPMEPRACVGVHDPATGNYTLYAGSGGAVRLKNDLADHARRARHDLPRRHARHRRQLRHARHDLSGVRAGVLGIAPHWPPREVDVRAAGSVRKRLAGPRPRGGSRARARQGRHVPRHARLNISNIGAHTGRFTSLQKGIEIMTSIYRVPLACFRARATLSNTAPTRPYRSSGRPESCSSWSGSSTSPAASTASTARRSGSRTCSPPPSCRTRIRSA
jgi:carbon-monoxide dehydrogenase large subunit